MSGKPWIIASASPVRIVEWHDMPRTTPHAGPWKENGVPSLISQIIDAGGDAGYGFVIERAHSHRLGMPLLEGRTL